MITLVETSTLIGTDEQPAGYGWLPPRGLTRRSTGSPSSYACRQRLFEMFQNTSPTASMAVAGPFVVRSATFANAMVTTVSPSPGTVRHHSRVLRLARTSRDRF